MQNTPYLFTSRTTNPPTSHPKRQPTQQSKTMVFTAQPENRILTPKTTAFPPNSLILSSVAQPLPHDTHTENDNAPQGIPPDDPDPHNSTICHPPNPPQPWRTSPRKPVKNTRKQGLTDGETSEHTTFAPTIHLQHTTHCVQHTHLCVQSTTTRQHHTHHNVNTRLIPLCAPPSQLSQTTLNVFAQDGRRFQTQICVEKVLSENPKGIHKTILKSVINRVTTKNQNFKRIYIGSLKSVKMVNKFGSSIIRVITTGHNSASANTNVNNKYVHLTSKQICFSTNHNEHQSLQC